MLQCSQALPAEAGTVPGTPRVFTGAEKQNCWLDRRTQGHLPAGPELQGHPSHSQERQQCTLQESISLIWGNPHDALDR